MSTYAIQASTPDDQMSLFACQRQVSQTCERGKRYAIAVYKVTLVREATLKAFSTHIRSSQDAVAILRPYLAGVDREHFIVLLLDRKNKAIGLNTVSIGSLTSSVVSCREVFKPAILANAAAIICAHNHPSGEAQPSAEDRALTTRLVEAGRLLGIQVLDHVILGDGTDACYSFADAGLLT
jgi:DNA repair protein RadC